MTTAAIEYNSWTSPSVGWPEMTRAVRITPATPANSPLVMYTSILYFATLMPESTAASSLLPIAYT